MNKEKTIKERIEDIIALEIEYVSGKKEKVKNEWTKKQTQEILSLFQELQKDSLSEMIESMGDDFCCLKRQIGNEDGKYWYKAESWVQENSDSQYEDKQYIYRKALTPLLAVSNLLKALKGEDKE